MLFYKECVEQVRVLQEQKQVTTKELQAVLRGILDTAHVACRMLQYELVAAQHDDVSPTFGSVISEYLADEENIFSVQAGTGEQRSFFERLLLESHGAKSEVSASLDVLKDMEEVFWDITNVMDRADERDVQQLLQLQKRTEDLQDTIKTPVSVFRRVFSLANT